MKIILFLFMAFSIAAFADDLTLITTDGQKHTGSITRVEPDGVVMMEDSGVEKVPFAKLPADVQKKYGYNAQKAAQFQQASAMAQAQLQQAQAQAVVQREQEIRERQKSEEKQNLEKIKEQIKSIAFIESDSVHFFENFFYVEGDLKLDTNKESDDEGNGFKFYVIDDHLEQGTLWRQRDHFAEVLRDKIEKNNGSLHCIIKVYGSDTSNYDLGQIIEIIPIKQSE